MFDPQKHKKFPLTDATLNYEITQRCLNDALTLFKFSLLTLFIAKLHRYLNVC